MLPANVAKYQVCNAVLNFVIRSLEGLCGINGVGEANKPDVLNVIGTLRKCVGTGKVPKGFQQLVQKIEEKVKEGFDKKINSSKPVKTSEVFQALHRFSKTNLNSLERQLDITSETSAVQSYITTFAGALKPDGSNTLSNLFNALKTLFENQEIKTALQKTNAPLTLIQNQLENNIDSIKNSARQLAGKINKLNNEKGVDAKPANAAVFTAVRDAATAFVAELQTKEYTSYYDKADWNSVSGEDDRIKCAKIFLGCLPLYYQALTYIYWGCHEHGGGWRNQTLANGALRSYFDSQGLLPLYVDRSKTGAHIADSALKKFSEFQQGMSEAISSSTFTYSTFTKTLERQVTTNIGQPQTLSSQCPLSALFHGASCYFRYQQITTVNIANGAPKTIREMLYFIAALQFSPQYDAFDSYVTSLFRTMLGNNSQDDDSELKLPVADSGTSATGNTLSAADVKTYLISCFLLPPSLLGCIQEPSTSEDPWLHSLFSNSQFNLSIPSSGAGIFGALSNYAYALQFQLHFLYQQCSNTYIVGCGWRDCRFGKDINASGNSFQSHICPTGCTSGGSHSGADHGQGLCTHDNCGTKGKYSPLQAFLTDNLKDFSRGHPSDPSSHLASCSGQMCHVPMGFAGKLPTDAGGGLNIAYALGSFCGGFNTPLRQLSEKLGCLTKRTPRTLGDMFGFLWHLNDQMFKTQPKMETLAKKLVTAIGAKPPRNIPTFLYAIINDKAKPPPRPPPGSPTPIGLSRSLEAMAPAIPFLYQLFMMEDPNTLPGALFDLTKHCHKWHTSGQLKHESHSSGKSCPNPNDLWSLYQGLTATARQNKDIYEDCRNGNCGGYLYPLTHTFGSTFAPKHASSYLSWFIHLTDNVEEGLREILERFKGLEFKNCTSPTCQ